MRIYRSKAILALTFAAILFNAAGPLCAQPGNRAGEVQEKMNIFQRSVTKFRRTFDRWNRCFLGRGKCTKEEKKQAWADVSTAVRKTTKYAVILLAVFGAGWFFSKSWKATKLLGELSTKFEVDPKEMNKQEKLLIGIFTSGFVGKRLIQVNLENYNLTRFSFPQNVLKVAAGLYYGKKDFSFTEFQYFKVDFGLRDKGAVSKEIYTEESVQPYTPQAPPYNPVVVKTYPTGTVYEGSDTTEFGGGPD